MEKLFPNESVISTDYFEVHQDWEVPIPGFFILAPHRELRSVADFTEEEQADFIDVLCKVRKAMHEALDIRDVYIFHNEDSTHGFHLWLFPRLDWMERFGKKIQSVRPIMEYARAHMKDEGDVVREYAKKARDYLS